MRPFFLLLPLLALPAAAAAAWKADAVRETPAALPGAAFVVRSFTQGEAQATLRAFRFDTRRFQFRVVDDAEAALAGASAAAARVRGVAAVNGGYFDTDFRPMGLRAAAGAITQGPARSRLMTGMLVQTASKPLLLRTGEYRPGRNTLEAIQCGPYLVDQGRAVAGLEKTRRARRTVVVAGPDTTWALVMLESPTLAGAAEVLATPGAIPGLPVRRALNLDGGKSTAFYAATAGGPEEVTGFARVRDYLAVVPRQ